MGEAMRAESQERGGIPYPPLEPDLMAAQLEAHAAHPDKLLVALYENGNGPRGFLTAFLSPYSFSRTIVAVHDVFYVRREARGSRAAARLVRFFQEWARANGAWMAMIAQHTAIEPERTTRFYERAGFRFMGTVHGCYFDLRAGGNGDKRCG